MFERQPTECLGSVFVSLLCIQEVPVSILVSAWL